jgi:leader peptidase (prepilin peptidase)/N-methyltransferase
MLDIWAFLLGCAVGSFLNVCIYRLPRGRSVVAPPSHCPQCGARLHAIDLIPLVSFLALGRKCRFCGGAISWRYFAVELITGAVFLAAWFACGESLEVLPCWIFAAVVVAVVFTDLDHMIIPDSLVVAGLAAAALREGLAVWSGEAPLLSVAVPGVGLALPRFVAGGLVGLGVFALIRAFSQLVFRREGMGLGDVKLAGAIGAMVGPELARLSFGLAIAVGAVLGVVLLALRVRRRMEYLPFGPFLAAASLVAVLAPGYMKGSARALYDRWLSFFGY